MQSYREMKVWQKSMDLVVEVYRLEKLLPASEKYGLSDQMRRCSVSIPSNIAEGFGRKANKEYIRFLNIARGSKFELETQLDICVRLGFLSANEVQYAFSLCTEIGKMLNSLVSKLTYC